MIDSISKGGDVHKSQGAAIPHDRSVLESVRYASGLFGISNERTRTIAWRRGA